MILIHFSQCLQESDIVLPMYFRIQELISLLKWKRFLLYIKAERIVLFLYALTPCCYSVVIMVIAV